MRRRPCLSEFMVDVHEAESPAVVAAYNLSGLTTIVDSNALRDASVDTQAHRAQLNSSLTRVCRAVGL